MNEAFPIETPPLLIIRLASKWLPQWEELEPGYFRKGGGWFEGMSPLDLTDSVRGWWRMRPDALFDRNIDLIVAVAAGRSRGLFRRGEMIGPRPADGRVAFNCRQVTRGADFDRFVGPYGKVITFPQGASNPVRYWNC